MCAKITAIVNGIKKDYKDKVDIKTIKVDENTKKTLTKEGLKAHGIVGKDKSGKIVSTVEGHNYKKDKVMEVIKKVLGEQKEEKKG